MSTIEKMEDPVTAIVSESLKKYAEFRPSVVQSSIWSKKFVLFVENLSVSFDGFKAVDIPQYGIEHGELRVIIGPNGADFHKWLNYQKQLEFGTYDRSHSMQYPTHPFGLFLFHQNTHARLKDWFFR